MVLQPSRKKIKFTHHNDERVVIHLDHSFSSSLLKHRLNKRPFILQSIPTTPVQQFSILTDDFNRSVNTSDRFYSLGPKVKCIGTCPRYGLIMYVRKIIALVDIHTGRISHRFTLEISSVKRACVELGTNGDDHLVVLGSTNKLIRMNFHGDVEWTMIPPNLSSDVIHDPIHRRLIVATEEGISLLKCNTGATRRSTALAHSQRLCTSHDGAKLMVLCGTSIYVLYGKKFKHSREFITELQNVVFMEWSVDGSYLLVGQDHIQNNHSRRLSIGAYDVTSGRLLASTVVLLPNSTKVQSNKMVFAMVGGQYMAVIKSEEGDDGVDFSVLKVDRYCCEMMVDHVLKEGDRLSGMGLVPHTVSSSLVHRGMTIPKPILWFLNIKWHSEWLVYEKEKQCVTLRMKPRLETTNFPSVVTKWLDENLDGLILGGHTKCREGLQSNFFLGCKMKECGDGDFMLYLIDCEDGHVYELTISDFISHCRPVLVEKHMNFENPAIGFFQVDYMRIIEFLMKRQVIQNGKLDESVLLNAYRNMKGVDMLKMANAESIAQQNVLVDGYSFKCIDLMVLALSYNLQGLVDFISSLVSDIRYDDFQGL